MQCAAPRRATARQALQGPCGAARPTLLLPDGYPHRAPRPLHKASIGAPYARSPRPCPLVERLRILLRVSGHTILTMHSICKELISTISLYFA